MKNIVKYQNNLSKLVIEKITDNLLKYQWQIFDFQGNEKDFEIFWSRFLNEHKCRSCICELNLIFLKKFGFKKIDTFYSYYPFSVVYRINDLTDDKFYIGMSEVEESWNNGYTGSGGRWWNHCHTHQDHEYERIILKKDFQTPLDTRNFEFQEIEKVFKDENNCNAQIRTQGQNYCIKICPECGKKCGSHEDWCSNIVICPECGGKANHHKKECSKYMPPTPCPECGAVFAHKNNCSKAKRCSECHCVNGQHKKSCSHYKQPDPCPECGAIVGHKTSCSKFKKKTLKVCSDCGGIGNHHYKNCSKAKICSECGISGGHHKKSCSFFKEKQSCPECGSKSKHKSWCSKATTTKKTCSECGASSGNHKKGCSLAKRCPECNCSRGHLKTCSHYKPTKSCPECGAKQGQHKKTCSKYKIPVQT